MKNPLVSIIIINWNGEELLKACLPSLKKINYKNFEIILVDNGSIDNSINFTKKIFPTSKIIHNKTNLGFAKANNQAIKQAKGELILFLNNDTKVTPNFLTILVNRLITDSKMGACQPKILHLEKKGKLDSIGSFLTISGFLYHLGFEARDSKKLDKEIKLFSGKGSCLLFKKGVLNKIGNFDADFFAYFEETDLCWRLWLAGYYLQYIPHAVIYHKSWGTTNKLPLFIVSFHSFKNRIASLIINLEFWNLLKIIPVHVIFCLFIALYYLVKLKPANTLAIIHAFIWNTANLPSTLKKRQNVQTKIRIISDKELFPQIMKNAGLPYYYYILTYSFKRSKVLGKVSNG